MPYKFFDSRKLQRKLFKDIKTDLCFLVFLKRACGKTNFTVFYSISNHFMVILACFKPFFYDQKSPFLSPKKGRFCSFKKSPLILLATNCPIWSPCLGLAFSILMPRKIGPGKLAHTVRTRV